jgi:hypothetical protein
MEKKMELIQTDSDIKKVLKFDIRPQPDDLSCGPTCLHALYNFYGENLDLNNIIKEVKQLEHGGTLAVFLAQHALQRGYESMIYTYNLQVFDPSWFKTDYTDALALIDNLKRQMAYKMDKGLLLASEAYIKYLEAGGMIRHQELTSSLIRKYLKKSIPMLTGLSSTYLYDSMREIPTTNQYDSIRGEPTGHFVVINGYNKQDSKFYVADPLNPNPMAETQYYKVSFGRLISSILLGILTYDANLLIIFPKNKKNAIPGL